VTARANTSTSWCSVVQRGAAWCSVVQRGAALCSVLQRVAACCSVLQYAAPGAYGRRWCRQEPIQVSRD